MIIQWNEKDASLKQFQIDIFRNQFIVIGHQLNLILTMQDALPEKTKPWLRK